MILYLRSIFHLRSLFRRRGPHCPDCCNLDGCLICERVAQR
jgi:hypothetical protein